MSFFFSFYWCFEVLGFETGLKLMSTSWHSGRRLQPGNANASMLNHSVLVPRSSLVFLGWGRRCNRNVSTMFYINVEISSRPSSMLPKGFTRLAASMLSSSGRHIGRMYEMQGARHETYSWWIYRLHAVFEWMVFDRWDLSSEIQDKMTFRNGL